MTNVEIIQELFRQMEWADAKIWTAILESSEAAGDEKMRERLYHIHMVQRAFLKVWKGEIPQPRASDFTESRALLAWGREGHDQITEYMSGIADMDLSRLIVMPWIEMFEARIGRKAEKGSLEETMLQVAMHSAYHRGQVATKLRELGGEPPLTDFIVWVWLGKPEPAWP